MAGQSSALAAGNPSFPHTGWSAGRGRWRLGFVSSSVTVGSVTLGLQALRFWRRSRVSSKHSARLRTGC